MFEVKKTLEFPVCMGMNQINGRLWRNRGGVPRVYGDEPVNEALEEES